MRKQSVYYKIIWKAKFQKNKKERHSHEKVTAFDARRMYFISSVSSNPWQLPYYCFSVNFELQYNLFKGNSLSGADSFHNLSDRVHGSTFRFQEVLREFGCICTCNSSIRKYNYFPQLAISRSPGCCHHENTLSLLISWLYQLRLWLWKTA